MENFRLLAAQVKFHQICTLLGSFSWKYKKFQLKEYREGMYHDTEEWSKIWRKTNLFFQQWQEFGKFWSKHLSLQNLLCDLSLLCKVYVWPKKYRRVIFNYTEKSCKIRRKNWLVAWKMTWGIWQIFIRTFESVKIGTFMHELKIYRGVICNDNEELSKIWKVIDLSFQNWHKQFDIFWLEHWKF